MAESIIRILPAAVAPQRSVAAPRERGDNERRGGQRSARAPVGVASRKVEGKDTDQAGSQDLSKGKCLDISA